MTEDDYKAKPFVKWVGGKRSIIKELSARLPLNYKNYYEPFVGGGALFFSLELLNSTIADNNRELITTYTIIKNKPQELIDILSNHKIKHSREYYYNVRSQYDNNNDIEIAARFIYLNKSCYNGLYRVNNRGEFNVPIGIYKDPNILDKTNIIACSKVLQTVNILHEDFSNISPNSGDFVYLDPPYYPITYNSFTKYTQSNFTEKDQIRLYEKCKQLHSRGVYFMLSNSDSQFIKNMYNSFNIEVISAPRNVNCKANGRQKVNELLIRNY